MKISKPLSNKPRPFLKWAGGKRQLISQMKKYFPKSFETYIEPFVGGGAVFFHILPPKAILMDINKELINCYKVVKENVFELIELLKNHKNEKNYYYKIRAKDRNQKEYEKLSDVEKASRMIYLNRCCYNGLYRVNRKGQFNVPFGKYKNPKFCDKENLLSVSKVLQDIRIIQGSFESCLKYANQNDFIYFDPPYQPISETSSFTSYSKEDFNKKSQVKLFNVFKTLDEKGCRLMLSNSNNDFLLNLYKDYKIIFLNAKRAINSVATKRGNIKEILVLN
ncbi:MAG: DNA adenine methylase [Promethearchaeota archaeon]|nr:MAG: DNA adenine methylase [Candidatus Lokiarchaeota archaeon]